MARPTKLTRKVIADIAQAVSAGDYLETAAAYAGISKSAFYDWLKKGRQQIEKGTKGLHRDLVEELEKAMGDAETRHVATVSLASKNAWQAAAWWLERRFPDRWGQRPRADAQGGKLDMPINISFQKIEGTKIEDALKDSKTKKKRRK